VVALANQAQSNGNPVYGIKNVPPSSSKGLPKITQPNVYFASGDTGYVVADTKQPRWTTSATAERREPLRGHGRRAADLVAEAGGLRPPPGRLQPADLRPDHRQVADHVRARPGADGEKAAPFLTFNQDPYAVVNDGQIDWIVDGYTTTNEYPYSQNADTQQVASGAACPAATTTCATR
jgi:uncharacterized membrane protein (UPF0182 family)